MNNNKKLTFELNRENNCLEIHGNPSGIRYLSEILKNIAEHEENHIHLMTESWGGNELSEEKKGVKNELINHVKIFNWDSDK